MRFKMNKNNVKKMNIIFEFGMQLFVFESDMGI